jgi:serine protease
MASPHVAAEAALIEALGITNPAAVKAVLQATATRDGIPDLKIGFGAGIMNAGRAVRYAILGTGAAQFALALALLYVCLTLARGGDYARFNPLALLAAIPASCGLFFLPYLPQLGTWEIPYRDFLCRPLPAWDIHLLGLSQHANPLFYSALLPLMFSLLLNRKHPWLQQLLIGFSVGYGACILHLALSEQAFVKWVPFSGAWLILNAALCVFIAVGLADARRPQRSR